MLIQYVKIYKLFFKLIIKTDMKVLNVSQMLRKLNVDTKSTGNFVRANKIQVWTLRNKRDAHFIKYIYTNINNVTKTLVHMAEIQTTKSINIIIITKKSTRISPILDVHQIFVFPLRKFHITSIEQINIVL